MAQGERASGLGRHHAGDDAWAKDEGMAIGSGKGRKNILGRGNSMRKDDQENSTAHAYICKLFNVA